MFRSILLLVVFAALIVPSPIRADDDCDQACQQALAETREATAAYHREIEALADGFVSTINCVSSPLGAMGVHYIHPLRLSDLTVNAAQPEVVLYEPQKNGKMRLVGVEYFVPVLSNGRPWFGGPNDPPPTVDNPAPRLFGRSFHGPMAGHDPGMPWHYDLHVWLWRHNPSGMFADFNPNVTCP